MKKSFAPVLVPFLFTVGLAGTALAVEPKVSHNHRVAAHEFHMIHGAATHVQMARHGIADIGTAHEQFLHGAGEHGEGLGHAEGEEGLGHDEGETLHHPIVYHIAKRIEDFIKNHKHPHNVEPFHVSSQDLHNIHDHGVQSFDFDQNGMVSWCEFGYMASESPAQVEHVRRVIQRAEANSDAAIDDSVCKTALTDDPVSGPYTAMLFESADDNGNGLIEPGESSAAIDLVMSGYDLNCDHVIDQKDVDAANRLEDENLPADNCSLES